jgi:hypothetical protein
MKNIEMKYFERNHNHKNIQEYRMYFLSADLRKIKKDTKVKYHGIHNVASGFTICVIPINIGLKKVNHVIAILIVRLNSFFVSE